MRMVWKSGSSGMLRRAGKLAENVFFVVRKALRDEGTSYHYLPPSRFVTLDESAANIVEGVLREIMCLVKAV